MHDTDATLSDAHHRLLYAQRDRSGDTLAHREALLTEASKQSGRKTAKYKPRKVY